jgi:hypothetical protein
LATKTIDKAEWDSIKAEKPEVAEQRIDIFSDLVWEGGVDQSRISRTLF